MAITFENYSVSDWEKYIIAFVCEYYPVNNVLIKKDWQSLPLTGKEFGLSGDTLYDMLCELSRRINHRIILHDYYDGYTIQNLARTVYQSVNYDKQYNV